MFLEKYVTSRLPRDSRLDIVNITKANLLRRWYPSSNKIYIVKPKSKFLIYELVLKYCYGILKPINCLDDFYIDIPKSNPERLEYIRVATLSECYLYNKFPKNIIDIYGYPTLPEDYVEVFGEFYNFRYLIQYLGARELNKYNYSKDYFMIRDTEKDVDYFHLGFTSNIPPCVINTEYWDIIKFEELV